MQLSCPSQNTFQTVVDLADKGLACALAVVLDTRGSTPCKAGAMAIMDESGVRHGTIGGGWVEQATQQRVATLLESGQPEVVDFDLESCEVAGNEPICGGWMRVLLDPTIGLHRDAYQAASAIQRGRRRGVLLTTVRRHSRCSVEVACFTKESISPDLAFPDAETVRLALKHDEAKHFVLESSSPEESIEVLVEPLVPQPVVLMVGGGHVGQAVATQAALVGFEVVVLDDREEFAREDLFPEGTATRCGEIGSEVSSFPIDEDTYVVIATRGHGHDAEALAECLNRPAAYIGMIGSRRKIAMMRKEFVDSGRCNQEQFDRVYAPIGLDIGAVAVPEIATSIVAQLIAVKRTGSAAKFSPE